MPTVGGFPLIGNEQFLWDCSLNSSLNIESSMAAQEGHFILQWKDGFDDEAAVALL